MLHFGKNISGGSNFFLEQIIARPKRLLAVADEIIQKNNFRIPKKLFTENIAGEKNRRLRGAGRNRRSAVHCFAVQGSRRSRGGGCRNCRAVSG